VQTNLTITGSTVVTKAITHLTIQNCIAALTLCLSWAPFSKLPDRKKCLLFLAFALGLSVPK
jgi:hypothetical protein